MIVLDLLLAAVKSRWAQQGLGSTFTVVTSGMPQERPALPYVIFDTLLERPKLDTNNSRFRAIQITLNVYNTPLETALAQARQASDALTFAPLVLSTGLVLLITDLPVRALEEDYFWHISQGFEATVQQTR